MSKRRLSVFAVGTADWMKYRPYPGFAPGYDGFYLRLANSVFEELHAPQRFFRDALRREQVVELSVVLASWFEDFANEIGLWSTFVRKNKDLYGYWLPFFPLDEYDPDDMNPEDLAYLIWHFTCKVSGKFVAPDSPGLTEVADALLELFDEALDEAPGTDFYDEYLSIGEDVYFFSLKSKLHWMAFQNYLTGPEFRRQMDEATREVLEKKQEMAERYGDPGKLIYAMQDDFLYKKSSSFLAFTMPDWLAEVARCPDGLRSDIRLLFRRIIGEFIYEGDDERCYHFRHLYTDRLFNVRQESVAMKGIRAGELVFTTIVCWRGEWWVTGTLASFGDAVSAKATRKKDFKPSSVTFYAWPDDKQLLMREMAADLEAAHLEYFGARMVFFNNEKDMEAAFEGMNDYYNNTKAKGKSSARPPKPPANTFFTTPASLNRGNGVAIFFEPGEGTFISPLLAKLAWWLEQPELTKEEAQPLFFDLFYQCSPAIVQYLLERFSARNLRFPVNTNLPLQPYLEFFMRFYNPGSFREKLPNNSLMPE